MSEIPSMIETGDAGPGTRKRIPRRDQTLLRLAAPSWRRRYLVEFADVLAHTPSGLRRTGGIAVLIARSWLRPGRHVYQPQERLRASLSTLLVIGVTVIAGWAVYRFVSVPLPATAQPPGAEFHYFCAVLAAVLFAASATPMLSAAPGRPVNRVAGIVRPFVYAVAAAIAGAAAFSVTPRPDRFGLGPASWLMIPSVTVLAAVPGVAIALHRTMQRLRPHLGLITLGSAWFATITAILALFCEPAVRETYSSGSWQIVLFWFCLTLAITATVTTGRGLNAALRDRRRHKADAQTS